MDLPFTEPFKIKMVENIYRSTKEQRESWIKDASFNLFNLRSEQVSLPRRVYTDNHMDYVAAVVRNVFERRDHLRRGIKIGWEAPIMRHFTVRLERL